MEISIPCYISDGGALKIKQAAKHSAFLSDFLLMCWTASPQRCCLRAAREEANVIAVNLFFLIAFLQLWGRISFKAERPEGAESIGDIVRKVTLNTKPESHCTVLFFVLIIL